MTDALQLDLARIAHDLRLSLASVERTAALLDEGNTVPFITRYRKDETGGLDEERVREIQLTIGRARSMLERKRKILKNIEAQGKLTPELEAAIIAATTPKLIEDLYLPFKPKKQTLATVAREKGLEPLAIDVLAGTVADLNVRAAELLSAEKELNTVEDVLAGVGHLVAEKFGEQAELRGRLRRIFEKTGKLVCAKIEAPPQAASEGEPEPAEQRPSAEQNATEAAAADAPAAESPAISEDEPTSEAPVTNSDSTPEPASAAEASSPAAEVAEPSGTPDTDGAPASSEAAALEEASAEAAAGEVAADAAVGAATETVLPVGRLFEKPAAPIAAPELKPNKKKKKKKPKLHENLFKDYFHYSEPLNKVPPHRVLAINRGERANVLRVKIEADDEALAREAEQHAIPPEHPQGAFLRDCLRDALTRLIIPSLEREIRRELTDYAEGHAVDVFIRNLRKLLLTRPVHGRRVLAVDPGFKMGCKLAALDEFGNLLGHGVTYIIGKDERRTQARQRIADFVKQYDLSVIAIGNGTGCRETEQLVAECLSQELMGQDVAYVVVNEAGASIYSTSPLGREELPQCDPLQRGAVSIGRRLLDPLSELVKINPANIGVGLYQHDMKARHLQDSLDAVVESCVNFVGVDVNSASPALLRYVSGMNQLTARRVYEYRRQHGPFKNREQLKEVPGFGDSTFVQAAGFLKIYGGDNPLDATWIHPESYDDAQKVLDKLGSDLEELAKAVPAPVVPPPAPPQKPSAFAAPLAELVAEIAPTVETAQDTAATSEPAAVESEGAASEITTDQPQTADAPPPEAPPAPTPALEAAPETVAPLAEQAEPAAEQVEAPSAAVSDVAVAEAPATPQVTLAERVIKADARQLAQELSIGEHLLKDILSSLKRPGLDPRENLAPPVFRRGVVRLEDLQPGMELSGTVLNVVDFGAFVDIGLSDSGLVHISRLADRFIRDPHEVVSVGDILKVWVIDIDKQRRRVSLTAIAPGSERPQPPKREPRPERERAPRPPRQGGGQPAGGQQPAGAGQQQRPPRPQRQGGGRRDQRPRSNQPTIIERKPTKPKPVKPITKKMEEGKEPMRSFSDLAQLFDKKKDKKKDGGEGKS